VIDVGAHPVRIREVITRACRDEELIRIDPGPRYYGCPSACW
jgi:hypothetical protein